MKLKNTQIVGFIITIVIGTALHFTYKWSGENAIVGAFSAVNESVWEHLKLLSVPMLLLGVAEYFIYGRKKDNFVPVRLLSILLGMALIITVFYTYSGIIGEHIPIVDIILFFVAAFVSYRYSYKMLQTNKYTSRFSRTLAILGVILLIACIIIFTFVSPHLGLFRDPISGAFGTSAT
ncbi:MAG: hypothetical protein CVU91_03845 [Firmicutes bacterium HGW-Firmicutes-16]|nr:MAG: hypothetical protein CVU91_03845 [Firmicutes bacterium HGW-Firmicutes-16]